MRIQKLHKHAVIPSQATDGSAGLDLSSIKDILVIPGQAVTIPTGIAVEIPRGWAGLLTLRSSFGFRLDAMCHIGIIDEDYRGEIKVRLFNFGDNGIHIKKGDRFAQLTVVPRYQGAIIVADELIETERGEGGFGSTGE